jgi:hypothetical protein
MPTQISSGKTVFARWGPDGYYYPGIVGQVLDNHVKIAFLDGYSGLVTKEQIIELEMAFETLNFEGNFQNGGGFYKGVVSSRNPMIINYDDGDVEQIDLKQLRGARPGEEVIRVAFNPSGGKINPMALTGFVLGLVSIFLSYFGLIGLLAIVFSIIGIATFKPEIESKNAKWMSLIGIILGGLDLFLTFIW